MKTDLVSRAGLVPAQSVSQSPDPVDVLARAVERVLAAVGPGHPGEPQAGTSEAEDIVRSASRHLDPGSDDALRQAVACAEAAADHLRYGELQEARLLLVATRGRLAKSRARRP